jgi:hypothetical protein
MANPFAGVANAFIAGREQRDMRNERAEQKNLMLTQRQQEVDRAYGMNLFEMAKDTPPESHQQLFDYFVQNAERFGATPPPFDFQTIAPQLAAMYREPKAESEPLVQVDEGGRPVYRQRSAAVGQPAYVKPAKPEEVKPPPFRTRETPQGKVNEEFVNGQWAQVGETVAPRDPAPSAATIAKAKDKLRALGPIRQQLENVKEAWGDIQDTWSAGPGGHEALRGGKLVAETQNADWFPSRRFDCE